MSTHSKNHNPHADTEHIHVAVSPSDETATMTDAEKAQLEEEDINMTKKYFKVWAIVMTVFIIVTFAVVAVSCDRNDPGTEDSNTMTTTTTQVTTTTSDEDDVTTTTRPKDITTTKATTTAVTTTTSDEENVTTTTTIATTTTNAQTTTTTTKATTTTPQQTTTVTTTKEEQNPPTVTTSYVLPDVATYVDIDVVVDDNNIAAAAVMFLQSYGVDTTVQEIAPYVTGCTNEETFADGITTFLTSKGIQKKAEIIITSEISSVVDGAYFTNVIHMFFYNGMPIVIYAVDDFNVYTIENGVLMEYDDAGFMAKYSGRYVKIL